MYGEGKVIQVHLEGWLLNQHVCVCVCIKNTCRYLYIMLLLLLLLMLVISKSTWILDKYFVERIHYLLAKCVQIIIMQRARC